MRPDTLQGIEKLVNTIVDDDVMEGQLKNSGLTLGDIELIRASFIETLKGRFHVRIRYPGNEEIESAGRPVQALPESTAPEIVSPASLEPADALLEQDAASS